MTPAQKRRVVREALTHIDNFSRLIIGKRLRPYQLEAANAILNSVLYGQGLTFAVTMSRQAGKNELSGQLEAYLMTLYAHVGGQIVKASPTFKPQTINSILRLLDRLNNPWTRRRVRRTEGYMVAMGRARTLFFSADPHSSIVGATAELMLEGDEAQDIRDDKWNKDLRPMCAATGATTVLYGTAWTSDTLLHRTIQHLSQLQAKDGIQRVFSYDANQVGQYVPAYEAYVKEEVARLGRNHPLIKTQYFLETIDATGGLFPPLRRALMRGDHPRRNEPEPGKRYALLIDVAGEDEEPGDAMERMMLRNTRRDATALTVVEVEPAFGRLPEYRVVDRKLWLGTKHTALHGQIVALAKHWHAVWVVPDSTGVGAGLASFLEKALGEIVVRFDFSSKTKSDLGWDFLAIVETGRYHDYIDDQAHETRQFWYEVEHCQQNIRAGPGRLMSWGVWESPAYDGLIAHGHDDLLISAAMTAVLDRQDWPGTGKSAVVKQRDALEEIDAGEW